MGTSKNKPNANEKCKSTGCGDRAYTHDGFTGKCNVVGCKCESFVGTPAPIELPVHEHDWRYETVLLHSSDTVERCHAWPCNATRIVKAEHASLCVNHPSSTFERMGGKVEFVAKAINASCLCGDEAVKSDKCPLHGTVEARYKAARAGARKALGSSPLSLDDWENGRFEPNLNEPLPLPIETAVLTVDGIQFPPVRFTQLAVTTDKTGLTLLFALDTTGQLWIRPNGEWQLDTMPVR